MKYILRQKNSDVDSTVTQMLTKELHIGPTLAYILCARGICTVETAREFLHPNEEQLHSPHLFNNMEDSVSLIRHTINTGGRICIYGDYDVDGASGCAILYMALQRMNANVKCILPSRMEHGYGLSIEAVESMAGKFDLLITVDCGITNVTEIDRAAEVGIQTIVTDHHVCPSVLPHAVAILNAKHEGEHYPYKDLCGAGVAFKLACALIGKEAFEWIDIAAIATIADIVPLTGENRVIAKLGLDKLNKRPNKGIEWLVKKSGIKKDEIDSQMVAYSLAPRINAAGRISTAQTAFELMTDQADAKLETIAQKLCDLNADRQERQERVVREAMAMEESDPGDRLIFHYKEDWDVGIIGLAASKLSEKYNKPAVLFGSVGDMYTGSARSIDGVNIFEALCTQSDLYEKFGGHAGAAGLTVKEEYLDTIGQRVNQYLRSEYADEVFLPVKHYDMETEPAKINGKLIRELDMLQPYGYRNSPVELLIRSGNITEIRAIGGNKHAKFVIRKHGRQVNAVKFGTQSVSIPDRADIVGTVQLNTFDNLPQMIVNTLSYEPSNTQLFEEASEYMRLVEKPIDCKKYFCCREELLSVFSILRAMMHSGMQFDSMEVFLHFVQKHASGLNIYQLTFALTVLKEIELIEVQKNDKIRVVVFSGKRELENSAIYNKFCMEG